MGLIDIILLILLFGFIFYGLFFGLVQTLGGLVGVFLGVIIAGRFFEPVAEWAQVLCWGNLAAAKVICFVLIFILVNRGVGLIFHVIDKIFDFVKIIPFVKSINRLLGAVCGFIEGAFLLGGILYISARFPFWEWFNIAVAESPVAGYLMTVFGWISPLLPEAVRQLNALVM